MKPHCLVDVTLESVRLADVAHHNDLPPLCISRPHTYRAPRSWEIAPPQGQSVQGSLAHKKQSPPGTLQ